MLKPQNKVFEEKILTTSTNPHIGILNGLNNIIQSNNIAFNKNDMGVKKTILYNVKNIREI